MNALLEAQRYTGGSQFLAALCAEDYMSLQPHLQLVPFKLGLTLNFQGEAAPHIYFPVNAVISIVATVEDGRGIEVALIGSEGLVGIWAALGSRLNWHEAVVQIPGDCIRVQADVFRAEMGRSRSLLDQVHRYTRYFISQISQSAVCNRVHRLEQRLARWLLVTSDHVKADEFVETHEFLSRMLGSDRSEVTVAAGMLRDAGLIIYARGKIKILDRKGLEKISCECYQIYVSEARRLRQESDSSS